MKASNLTPRMKKALIQSFALNAIILLCISAIIITIVLPKYQEYEWKKVELINVVNEKNKLSEEGVSYTEFKTIALRSQWIDEYTKNVISSIDKQFYDQEIVNASGGLFTNHINWIEEKISEFKSSQEFVSREESLQKILPVYSEWQDLGLSELDFVSYIEKLLYTFNLSSTWDIWVWSLVKYSETDEEDSIQNTQVNNLEESIYYIPLSFQLIWQKKDVFEFLHFFENVWSIELEWDILNVPNDNLIGKVLQWELDRFEYNIYEAQIADISKFTATDYPDSSTFSNNKKLGEIINTDQARDEYEVSVELRFYVAGIPGYSMRKYIDGVITRYQELKANILKYNSVYSWTSIELKTGDAIRARDTLTSLSRLFVSLDEQFLLFQKEYQLKADIEKSYQDAIDVNKRLDVIYLRLSKALQDLK